MNDSDSIDFELIARDDSGEVLAIMTSFSIPVLLQARACVSIGILLLLLILASAELFRNRLHAHISHVIRDCLD
jgi:hypothetical protein